ncbi:TetR/AcrR family transcriptional regulator [Gordonia insulae]|uniref:HTH tetR-type domain-containing protein n=1 Tax=Gordonia insulae TaxID=2420509 RepID=A0A3G8JR70_9ACTN|nr:TetR/AcrR family transcriptional regulator [Gordonia insulae]AZG47215.1 hypothetical protein D7316_03823 [Gordonia insulae]
MTADEQRWRGTSPADRTEDRRRRLVEAGCELLGREGETGFSVRAVCRTAAVGPRHFYEIFADLDALLTASYDHAVGLLAESVSTAITAEQNPAGLSSRDRLRLIFSAAVSHLEAHPDVARIVFGIAMANDVLRVHAAVTLTSFVDGVRDSVVDDGPTRDALQTTMLSGGLAAVFSGWLSGGLTRSRDEIVDYCTDVSMMILAG